MPFNIPSKLLMGLTRQTVFTKSFSPLNSSPRHYSTATQSTKKSTLLLTSLASLGAGATATYFWLTQGERKHNLFFSPNEIKILPSANARALEKEESPKKFIDFLDAVPAGYKGKVFQLSQNYPKSLSSTEDMLFMKYDFRLQPNEYMQKLREHIYATQLPFDWRPEENPQNKWFHIPWMHVGRHPREFIRGMTRERTAEIGELGPNQKRRVQNWAVGFYNDIGGYTIGKVWEDPNNPKPELSLFSHGTVVVKILFTEATPEEVPELEGTVEWPINVLADVDDPKGPKVIKKLRLLQMDVAVRDNRADSTTGWVFGTYVYDKTAPGANPWQKMVPVGLMWGNDPGVTEQMVKEGTATIKESIINPDIPAFAKRRLGWGGRLNGPVDNFISSCSSCHSTAQWPPKSPIVPPANSTIEERLRWFRNIKAGERFDEGTIPLDYSLQMLVSMQNFYAEHNVDRSMTIRSTPAP